jgi:hypothetical protein
MQPTIKQENKTVSDWLLNYHERLNAYKEKCSQFATLGATQYDGMPKGTSVGNPTQSKGMSLANLETDKDWLLVVEATESTLSEKKRMFLHFRRQMVNNQYSNGGRPGWMDNVQYKYAEWHNRRYGCDHVPGRQTMLEWWKEIVEVGVRIAIRKKIL